MTECKNRYGTRATRRAHLRIVTGAQRKVRHRPRPSGPLRAVWAKLQHVSRSGCVTNHSKLVIPGGRKA